MNLRPLDPQYVGVPEKEPCAVSPGLACTVLRVRIETVWENVHHSVDLYERVGYHETAAFPRYRRPMA